VISLASVGSGLASFNTCKLFFFSMQLLNFPSEGTFFQSFLSRYLRQIIGNDVFRAIGNRHSEQLYFHVLGVLFYFNPDFAVEK
jgi:hypothetical protein